MLPLANSLECVELTRKDIQDAHGKHIANVRGELIPYIRLSEYFQMEAARPEREQIMVVETEHGRYGFVVDQVLGDHQTVIKNLGRLYRNVQVVSGATILGNGTVALILDPHRLVQNAFQSASAGRSAPRSGAARRPQQETGTMSVTYGRIGNADRNATATNEHVTNEKVSKDSGRNSGNGGSSEDRRRTARQRTWSKAVTARGHGRDE